MLKNAADAMRSRMGTTVSIPFSHPDVVGKREIFKLTEDEHRQGKPSHVSANFGVPVCSAETISVEDTSLGAVDQHSPEPNLPDDLIHRFFRHQKLFKHVTETIKCCSKQHEKIPFHLSWQYSTDCITVFGIVRKQETETSAADQYAKDLSPLVAYMEEEEGDDHDDDNSPEVDQLGAQNCRVSVCKDDEIIAFYIKKSHDYVW